MRNLIVVCHRAVGYHHWPDAPPEVDFLRATHRHVFSFKVALVVTSDDRELEFFVVQRIVRGCVDKIGASVACGTERDFGSMSCEQLAKKVAAYLPTSLATVLNAIEVWEDDENGARVEF